MAVPSTITAQSLRQNTISGIGWSVISRVGRQSFQFVFQVILARILLPDAFGLVGMITVFVGFANIFMDLGFGSALIQKQDADEDHYSSIFWLNVAAGLSLMLIFVAASPLIARFYNQPDLIPLTIVSSINFFVGSFSVIHISLLKKELNFKKLAAAELSAVIVSGVFAVLMAWFGWGVWSLVLQSVLLTTITAVLLWIFNDWRPNWRFRWSSVKDLLGFSANLLGFTSFNYWIRNADNLLIGRFLGTLALGIYSYSYSIMLLPLSLVSRTISDVMFPALSSIQDDKPRIARIYLSMTRAIALVTFPMMVGLWVVTERFVLVIFGTQWLGMVPILKVFSIIGLIQSIGTLNGNLYLSQGRSDLQFKVGLVIGTLGVGSILIGLRWGIEGVAIAYGIFSVLVVYPSIHIAVSLVDLTFIKVAENLLSITLCSWIMAFFVWGIGQFLPPEWPDWLNLLIQVFTGSIIYFGLIHFLNIQAYYELRKMLVEQWKNRGLFLKRV
ncbi:MAG: colanic acid exporter [Anaerolineaceae bacterium]|nr:colanic acid exporter [Anaerolineaceae bacterium]